MSFYEINVSQALRFGDVVNGFVLATSKIANPGAAGLGKYGIEVQSSGFFVILSPCCSISDKVISIAPLQMVRRAFFKNPYFAEKLTNINRVMSPEKMLAPEIWGKLDSEEKLKRLAVGSGYAFNEIFIYEAHALFPPYKVDNERGEINTYMVDFRDAHKVSCDAISTPKKSPLHTKVLELSISTRSELREKMAAYYARIPDEDRAFI